MSEGDAPFGAAPPGTKGQLSYRHNYKDGRKDGLQEAWYANGQLKYRHNYKVIVTWLWEEWYDTGQLRYRHDYKDGKEDGLQEGWDENGQVMYRNNSNTYCTYRNCDAGLNYVLLHCEVVNYLTVITIHK